MTANNDTLNEIHQMAREWAQAGYPYHVMDSLSAAVKSFVRHPHRALEISSPETLQFLMVAGLHIGGDWHYWVDKNVKIGGAVDRIAEVLGIGHDRPKWRALYALQSWKKAAVERAVKKQRGNITESIQKRIKKSVYSGKMLDYIKELQRITDAEKAKKADVVMREIISYCKTAPDFGAGGRKRVFISYNHKDAGIVDTLRALIESENVGIIIDTDYLRFGDNIKDFIGRSVRNSDYTLAIISKNSLLSPWVIHEALETFMHEHVNEKMKYIPLVIDKSFYEDGFFVNAILSVDNGIQSLVADIAKLSRKGVTTGVLDNKKDQLVRLRTELGNVLGRLSNNLYADCTSAEAMTKNIKRLCKQILEG